MPHALTQWLLDLLGQIEAANMPWPKSLMQARVIMLGKTEHAPTSPLQIRPITIASRIYRTWSRYRALQISRHLQSLLPREIAGTAAGVGADQLIATLTCEIEDAHYRNSPKMGATVDLVKCFNQIPRQPIIAAVILLGIPERYLHALDSMFAQMTRLLEIAQQIGDPCHSTTGVPEGCCFSTVCMLSLTAWVTRRLELAAPDSSCVAYADNWEILASSIQTLSDAIGELWSMVTALRMEVAVDKSWTWATHEASAIPFHPWTCYPCQIGGERHGVRRHILPKNLQKGYDQKTQQSHTCSWSSSPKTSAHEVQTTDVQTACACHGELWVRNGVLHQI